MVGTLSRVLFSHDVEFPGATEGPFTFLIM